MNKFRITFDKFNNRKHCIILTMLEGDSDWGVYKSYEMCDTSRYPLAGESFVYNGIVFDIQDLLALGYVLDPDAYMYE